MDERWFKASDKGNWAWGDGEGFTIVDDENEIVAEVRDEQTAIQIIEAHNREIPRRIICSCGWPVDGEFQHGTPATPDCDGEMKQQPGGER